MLLGGFQKSSLIDFPGKIAAIIFTQGCNFKCGYCHNPALVPMLIEEGLRGAAGLPAAHDSTKILDFLKTRTGKLDGVVITGGEPTLQPDLAEFLAEIKALGFDIKLDTNGTNPKMLKHLVRERLVDYVAMDIKGPIEKYPIICKNSPAQEAVLESINFLIQSGIEYEFRTTVVKSQLEKEDFVKISQMIKGAKKYYLQKFVAGTTLDEIFATAQTYSELEFQEIKKIFKNSVQNVYVR